MKELILNETVEIRVTLNRELIISILKWSIIDNVILLHINIIDLSKKKFLKSLESHKVDIHQYELNREYNVIFSNLKYNLFQQVSKNNNENSIQFYFHKEVSCWNTKTKKQIEKAKHPFDVRVLSIMLNEHLIVGDEYEDNQIQQPLLFSGSVNNITIQDIEATSNKSSSPSAPNAKITAFLFFNVVMSVLSTLEFGYNTGVIASTILEIQTLFHLTVTAKSLLVSSILFGAMFGSIISGALCDRFGRKQTLLGNNFLYILGPLLSALARNYATLVIGRIISGMGVGIASSAVPLYITEISPMSTRGALGLLRQSTVTLGIMVSSLVAYGLIKYETGWRWTFAISIVPSLIQILFGYWFIESPRWLISKDRCDEARSIMKKVEPDLPDIYIDTQISQIRKAVIEQSGDESWFQLLQRKFIKVYIIGFGLNMFQQFVGINCVIYYSGTILEDAGFTKDSAVLIGALVGIPQLIILLISVWLIDRFGRKPLLIYGLVGMMGGLAILGYSFYGDNDATGKLDNRTKGWLAVAGMVFFKLCFSLGLGPIPAIISTEIYPSKVRSKAVAISQLLNWLANFIVNISFLHLLTSIGEAPTYWLFGGVSFVTLLFVYFLVPETKGVSIEELSKKLYLKDK
ncbi:sugar transporter family protein [Tieghemostelium lacteum]|uniref:Sugar transporter family protein n=1 Tax=Tieghemostelium lacteum TaxID=361077 RepID=A0A151Z9F4_TIELA|nr:sugar transporter family protein [Tieghemostelium lacteum]|eukprot:KYQ90579.1 sugar transporter family protein [Tieghemostelium lacteum]